MVAERGWSGPGPSEREERQFLEPLEGGSDFCRALLGSRVLNPGQVSMEPKVPCDRKIRPLWENEFLDSLFKLDITIWVTTFISDPLFVVRPELGVTF